MSLCNWALNSAGCQLEVFLCEIWRILQFNCITITSLFISYFMFQMYKDLAGLNESRRWICVYVDINRFAVFTNLSQSIVILSRKECHCLLDPSRSETDSRLTLSYCLLFYRCLSAPKSLWVIPTLVLVFEATVSEEWNCKFIAWWQ